MTSTAPAITATRTYLGSDQNPRAVITVRVPTGTMGREHQVFTLGGKRAMRAAAAIVVRSGVDGKVRVEGLRADLHAAEVEAHRLATRTSVRVQNYTAPVTPADWAVAVPVA